MQIETTQGSATTPSRGERQGTCLRGLSHAGWSRMFCLFLAIFHWFLGRMFVRPPSNLYTIEATAQLAGHHMFPASKFLNPCF